MPPIKVSIVPPPKAAGVMPEAEPNSTKGKGKKRGKNARTSSVVVEPASPAAAGAIPNAAQAFTAPSGASAGIGGPLPMPAHVPMPRPRPRG